MKITEIRSFCLALTFGFLYIAGHTQVNHNVDLLYHWNDTSLTLNYRDSRYNDVWAVALQGREYGIIGSTYGTHFFDITDPSQAIEVDRVEGRVQGNSLNHRDFHSSGNYLYGVCDQGSGSLQIFDMSYLPDSVHLVYDSDALFMRAHNIFIDTSSSLLYACGSTRNDNTARGLEVFDISNPLNPSLVYEHAAHYVHDVFARNDTVFFHAGSDGMFVYDFSIPNTPVLLGQLINYPSKGYNHSGWLNEKGNIYVFADENYGLQLKICDVSDLSDIQVLTTFGSQVTDSSIAHNVMIKDGYVFTSYYNDGLQIFDIKSPSNPVKVGWYDTFPLNQKDDYRGAWGVNASLPSGRVLISDRNSGLYVFDVNHALSNELIVDEFQVNIYPNPSNNITTVSVLGYHGTFEVEVLSLDGKTIFKEKNNNGTQYFLLPTLPSGMFFVKVMAQGEKIIQKLVSL